MSTAIGRLWRTTRRHWALPKDVRRDPGYQKDMGERVVVYTIGWPFIFAASQIWKWDGQTSLYVMLGYLVVMLYVMSFDDFDDVFRRYETALDAARAQTRG